MSFLPDLLPEGFSGAGGLCVRRPGGLFRRAVAPAEAAAVGIVASAPSCGPGRRCAATVGPLSRARARGGSLPALVPLGVDGAARAVAEDAALPLRKGFTASHPGRLSRVRPLRSM